MADYIGTSGNDTYTVLNTDSSIYALSGNDKIYLTNLSGSFHDLYAGDGNDFMGFTSGAGTAFSQYFYGGFGTQVFSGNSENDNFFLADGTYLVTGGVFDYVTAASTGAIVPFSGSPTSGSDVIYGGSGRVAEYGFDGDDTLYAGSGNDNGTFTGFIDGFGTALAAVSLGLYGGDGNDLLVGGTGTDWLYGGNGDDTIYSGTGSSSILSGDAGNDLLWIQGGNATAYGGDGNDLIYTIGTNTTMYGGNGDDQMAASNTGSTMYGDAGNDIIFGGTAADTIYGGTGNDALAGYLGNDVLYGGLGNDYFNLTYDVHAGQYDNIGDWNVGGIQDYLYLNAGLQSVTTFIQQSGYVDVHVALGTSAYDVFVFGGFVANVQADTFFV